MRVITMSDQAFNEYGDPVVPRRGGFRNELSERNGSQFLARFGVTLFWGLVIAIVLARVVAGV